MLSVLAVIAIIAILILLVFVHEFGHFITAKISGVRVDEFGFGFPPRAILIGRWRGTEYTVNWIPLGGFVRLFGEENEHGSGSFLDAPRWKQIIILLAGVTMNAIMAFVLFTGAYAVGILHPVDTPQPGASLIISQVIAGSPAEAAGLAIGDRIINVHDTSGAKPTALTVAAVSDFTASHGGQDISLTYVRAGATSTVDVIPAHAVVSIEAGRPTIGVGLALVVTKGEPIGEAIVDGYYQTIGSFETTFVEFGHLIGTAVHGSVDLSQVSGPIGIISFAVSIIPNGWGDILSLAGLISVNLVIVNLIPIPALDGGRVCVVLLEGLMRRAAPRLAMQVLNTLGVALIILLAIIVTYHDIVRIVVGQVG